MDRLGKPGADGVRAVVHNFRDQLAWSQNLSDEPAWTAFYQKLWPQMTGTMRVDQRGQAQRDGTDRLIVLPSGRMFRVDEKKRLKDYGDVLLEEWSVFYGEGHQRNKIGWALDPEKHCDFIAYAIIPAQRCYFLPFEHLRLAFMVNRSQWARRPNAVKDAQNEGYITRNVAVPWADLKIAIVQQMNRRFGDRIDLPTPMRNGSQLEFVYGED